MKRGGEGELTKQPYDEANICEAKTRSGTPCKLPAGWGTDHPGTGRCKLHGGKSTGPPKNNKNAVKHGFFSRIFPDDEETQDILAEIQLKSPIQILWEQIVIQYTAIARAQKLMFVRDHGDKTIEKVGYSTGNVIGEKWEVQQAWDKQASFLTAQSRAIKTLESLINKYEELLKRDLDIEEQQLKIETLKVQLDKIKDPGDIDMTAYLDALRGTAEQVWANEPDDEIGADDE